MSNDLLNDYLVESTLIISDNERRILRNFADWLDRQRRPAIPPVPPDKWLYWVRIDDSSAQAIQADEIEITAEGMLTLSFKGNVRGVYVKGAWLSVYPRECMVTP